MVRRARLKTLGGYSPERLRERVRRLEKRKKAAIRRKDLGSQSIYDLEIRTTKDIIRIKRGKR